eukprot:TRINITY_DN12027_c0_g1_i1.p1 TRINITY_DN12027_c0_g1~~TRINITY_DN12027_c0_g1_i1.p1  ORF type:complete len:701 (+),score=157.63 TRINITY_DN12027_c0_g1_i1:59-2161(+)
MCTGGEGFAFRKHESYGLIDPESERSGFGANLWNAEAGKQFRSTPTSGAVTLSEILTKSKEKYPDHNCAGWRQVVKVHQVEENGSVREKIELANEYKWLSFASYNERVLCLARGLAFHNVSPGTKVVVYAETQMDWLVACFAAWHNNAQIVTIYATLGEDGAVHGINETEASTIFVDAKLMKVLAKALPKCKSVKTVITMGESEQSVAEKVKGCSVALHTIDEVINSGKTWSATPHLPRPEDVAVIMYTSGTTGTPKGVCLTHGSVVAVVAGIEYFFKGMFVPTDIYIAYLPLAHIMEMAAEIVALCCGMQLGYGSPHTLTDSSVKLKRPESMGDAPLLKPHLLVCPPAILEKVYQSVQSRRESVSGMKQKMFTWALENGNKHFASGKIGSNWFYNRLVFGNVQRLLGGDLKAIVTGSAPLSPAIQEFIQTVFAVPVRQGFGLTETGAGSCGSFWGDNASGTVGPPMTSAVVRLADWPEGNYMNSDKEKPGVNMRRGEVLIGGPTVSAGYYINEKNPNPELLKKNEDDFLTLDGIRFFRSGDIGQILKSGVLQIIDRKKDLWKGPNGEYVALTKVEAALALCDYVELGMCYGRTGGDFPIALICPQKPRIVALGRDLGLQENFEVLCENLSVIEAVSKACKAVCKERKLVEFEIPKKFALIADPWSVENELLTAAMKLKRPQIVEKHQDAIEKMYKSATE